MPKLKSLSGKDVIEIFRQFNFLVVNQKGSHIKLSRFNSGFKQTLTIPNHKELDRGTIKAIFNQAVRYIPENDLRKYFY